MLYPLEFLCEKIAGDWGKGDSEKESCVRKTEYVSQNKTETHSHTIFSINEIFLHTAGGVGDFQLNRRT